MQAHCGTMSSIDGQMQGAKVRRTYCLRALACNEVAHFATRAADRRSDNLLAKTGVRGHEYRTACTHTEGARKDCNQTEAV